MNTNAHLFIQHTKLRTFFKNQLIFDIAEKIKTDLNKFVVTHLSKIEVALYK